MFKVISKDITKYSTIRTPSYTKYFAILNNVDDIKKAINFSKKNNLRFKILGNGSNILFSKDLYDDILFLKLGDGFKSIQFHKSYVEIGGNYSLIQAGRTLISKGYSNFIFFNLIPATIGGAIRQNAGTGIGEEIQDVCLSTLVYDITQNKTIELSCRKLCFSYRNSLIKKYPNRYLVLSAKFRLADKVNNIAKLTSDMILRVKEKTDREPKGYCFGSTFMNSKMSAWEYIDSIYDDLEMNNKAYFSKKHKNWIINNNGTGEDVAKLIKNAQKLINKKFNIDLKEEVDII